MKTALVFVGLLLLATAGAQQDNEQPPKGVIYGTAIGQDGQPAKGIVLTAYPLGVPLGTALPSTKTNGTCEYRLENLLGGADILSTPKTKTRDTQALVLVQQAIATLPKLSLRPNTEKQNLTSTSLQGLASSKSV
jgi:hypothetical protein